MSVYAPNTAYYAEFTTCSSTGAATNADSNPTVTVNHNGTDDGTFSSAVTVTVIDAGRYKVTGTVPVGYSQGDRFIVTVNATIGGVVSKAVIDSCQVSGDVYPIVNSGTFGCAAINNRLGAPAGASIAADIASANAALSLISGLVGHNQGVRNETYDGGGNLTGATLCSYDSPAHASLNDGSTGLLHSWTLTLTYSGGNQIGQVSVSN